MPSRARSTSALGVAFLGALLWQMTGRSPAPAPAPTAPATAPASAAPRALAAPANDAAVDDRSGRSLRLPSGAPASLTCRDALRIIEQARSHLAASPDAVDPRALADGTADWLDPHGLWSAAPDAPLGALLRRRERDLLRELEAGADGTACTVADEAGALLVGWIANLAPAFDDASQKALATTPAEAWHLAAEPAFEDRTVARPARDLARELGHKVGVVARTFGRSLEPYALAARGRYLPSLSAAAWSHVVLAAAVRAYLPQIDPHGGWAPLDEETLLYELDLEVSPPERLWQQMVRTSVGVRVESGASAPVLARDLVLEVATVSTAGLSVEQVEQLAVLDDVEPGALRSVVVLREGEGAPRTLEVPVLGDREAALEAEALPVERVPYGDADVLLIGIGDVPDDLGDLLAVTLARARASRPKGIVLDLRGNGGGSTDGANAALGLFLPGAPLFPLKRRDGVVETERAPEPPETDRWTGPVAALVDADTASAAEMIAGALGSYRRGVVAGARTYGKGCAQEYLDDESHSGVLRLTTLLYALPDGSPVQRTGLFPALHLGFAPGEESEATLAHALPIWRGPDVRDAARIVDVPWPSHHGRVGPCKDDAVCRALRAIGSPRSSVARGTRH